MQRAYRQKHHREALRLIRPGVSRWTTALTTTISMVARPVSARRDSSLAVHAPTIYCRAIRHLMPESTLRCGAAASTSIC
jgi:hypothetical protein